jgi:4-amino-4-deoxy-L-arabinose transferase-like glycosyltransferase
MEAPTRFIRWLSAVASRQAVAAGVLAFALMFAGTTAIPVMGRDEARFAQAAREMLANGELVVPTFGGVDRYHKPILVYWCTMASYATFGVGVRPARLPANLAGAVAVAVLTWAARRRFGRDAGWLAGAMLAVTLVFHVEARACTADMVLLLPTLVMMLAFERVVDGAAGARGAAVLWLSLGLGVLAKGPVAPAWLLMTAVAMWLLRLRWRVWQAAAAGGLVILGWWFAGPAALLPPLAVAGWQLSRSQVARAAVGRLRPGWGVPLAATVVLPWLVAAWLATDGAFLREGIGHHVVERSFSAFESHGGFPGFYLATCLVAGFPCFPLLADAVARRSSWQPEDRGWRFLVAWLVGPLVLIELVQTKLVHYWLCSYPAAVLLVVGWLVACRDRPVCITCRSRVLLGAGGAVVAAAPIALSIHFRLPELLIPAVVSAAVVGAGTVAALVVARRRTRRVAVILVLTCALFWVLVSTWFLPRLGGELLGPSSGRAVTRLRADSEPVVVFKMRDDELLFYLPLDVVNCRSEQCLADRIAGGGRFLGVAREELLEQFQGRHPRLQLEFVARVEGIDLARGRAARAVLFRPRTGHGGS